ncbi:trypsin-like peptidase domain-containing protein [Candidatus Saccharibacteria bacterium]|nr:trypsin-like peptidase domain-containing protein [Candidatus Saccharibacteria bacterium]
MPKNPTIFNTNPKKSTSSHHRLVGFALVLGCLGFLLGGASLTLNIIDILNGDTPITFLGGGSDGNSANFTDGSIADVASKVSPAVVSILTETSTENWLGQSTSSQAAGTGFIISSDGYILTNKHVVEDARNISVVLDDGNMYGDVKLIGIDPLNDAAIIKIPDAENLPTVKLGDSKTITVGQQVIAVGNTLGQYSNTVTVGIISGQNRSITATDSTGANAETLTDMLQTDASINQGNSGGPLVNAAGEVIGINTAVATSANNLGFAIPIASVKGMVKRVQETGKVERAYLGVYYISITPEIAKKYELPSDAGAYIYSSDRRSAIIRGGTADKAGLEDEDIIISINGIKVGTAGSVSTLIGEYAVGDKIQLGIIRNGKEMALNATLQAHPKN